MANHGFSGHRERGLDEVKEQNLVTRNQSKSRRTSTRAISRNGKRHTWKKSRHAVKHDGSLRNAAAPLVKLKAGAAYNLIIYEDVDFIGAGSQRVGTQIVNVLTAIDPEG